MRSLRTAERDLCYKTWARQRRCTRLATNKLATALTSVWDYSWAFSPSSCLNPTTTYPICVLMIYPWVHRILGSKPGSHLTNKLWRWCISASSISGTISHYIFKEYDWSITIFMGGVACIQSIRSIQYALAPASTMYPQRRDHTSAGARYTPRIILMKGVGGYMVLRLFMISTMALFFMHCIRRLVLGSAMIANFMVEIGRVSTKALI